MQVSQIYISDSKADLPEYLATCVAQVKKLYPEFEYHLYNQETLRQFIADHFDASVVSAFDTLKPYAYKADLGKYCLLYALGGWYFDISVKLVNTVSVPDDINLLAFRDIQQNSKTSWACGVAIMYAKPNNPVFQTAIDLVLANCQNHYYGINPLCTTGPVLFGQALAIQGANTAHIFGDLFLTPENTESPAAFFAPDGTIVGLLKPTGHGGDMGSLGAQGTNNYGQMWGAKDIFNESENIK